MTRVFHVSTLFGAMTLAAAVDEGRFGGHDERRLLLVSSTSPTPEAYPSAVEQPGFASIRDRFDDVVSWNDVIAPLHPAAWSPRVIETPLLARSVRQRLGLEELPAELVLESVAVAPARAVAALIRDCPITVYGDGLASYGPTGDSLPPETAGRIHRLLHLDLLPGVRPLLLSEYGVPSEVVSTGSFRAVVDAMPAATAAPEPTGRRAIVVGQYLSALGLLTEQEESDLYLRMLDALVAGGYTDVVFKPHPTTGRTHSRVLAAGAAERGVALTVAHEADPAEVCFARMQPDLVVGCFSTALATAAAMYDLPVATMATELVLERLTPYENGNRIPATVIDATAAQLYIDGSVVGAAPTEVELLVRAVGYCMRSDSYPQLRQSAVEQLAEHGRGRYFKKRRLESLDLVPRPAPKAPAAAPPPPAPAKAAATLAGSLRSAAAERIRRRSRG